MTYEEALEIILRLAEQNALDPAICDSELIAEALEQSKAIAVFRNPADTLPEQFNWTTAPVICELDGYKWLLGPEATEELSWQDAINWCKEQGGELPPREVLLMCYLNKEIRPLFKEEWYWSSTEFFATNAWGQNFSNGGQYACGKGCTNSARAVRKVLI